MLFCLGPSASLEAQGKIGQALVGDMLAKREIQGFAEMKKAALIIGVLLLVMCVAGGYGVKLYMAAKNKPKPVSNDALVQKGDVTVKVIETGTIDSVKSVEVKSRVSGRLAKLLVDVGDVVKQGDLIAIIDPKESQLQVDQAKAQLMGAESAVARAGIEIRQRKISSKAAYDQAVARLQQVRSELKVQPSLSKAAVEQAESSLASSEKELVRLKTSVHPNERTAAETTKKEADANYANARSEYERNVELQKKGYVSKKAVENAQLSIDLAKARLESAEASLSRLDSQQRLEISKAEEEVSRLESALRTAKANRVQDVVKQREYESAAAAVEQARAALDDVAALEKGKEQSIASAKQLSSVLGNSERELGETEIRAPISGVVTQKLVQEGELVASLSGFSAGTPVVRIENRDQMKVTLDINEVDVTKLSAGMDVDIDVDALPNQPLKGSISKISPISQNMTSTTAAAAAATGEPVVKYTVEVLISNKEPKLKSGMSAKCSMLVVNRKNVLRLPLEFVGKEGTVRFVMIAPAGKEKNAKGTKQVVKVGESSGAFIEIVSGVKEGTKVVKPDFKGPERKGMMQFGPDRPEEEEPKK